MDVGGLKYYDYYTIYLRRVIPALKYYDYQTIYLLKLCCLHYYARYPSGTEML